MASDYGPNFGFRRSDESVRVSEGRFRTPATGSPLLMGTAVGIDPAAPGFLRVLDADAPLVPGVNGILLQEEVHIRGVYDLDLVDSFSLSVAKKNTLSVVTTGGGTKVWFKNGGAQTRIDGRVISAVTILVTAGLGLGDSLGWNGTAWAKTANADAQWMTVTALDVAGGYCEAVLVR